MAEKFTENLPEERTFTSCITETDFYAEQQWDQDFSLFMFPGRLPTLGGATGKDPQPWDKAEDEWLYHTPTKKQKKKKGKGQGKGKKGGKPVKKQQQQGGKGNMANQMGKLSIWLKDKKVQAAKWLGQKVFCGDWNSKGTCKNDSACTKLHKFSIMVSA